MIKKYEKKPVIVEAVQLTDEQSSYEEVLLFVTCDRRVDRDVKGDPVLIISTLEGEMTASLGDYIIKGVKGEFYPCREDIFKETYEEVL